MNPNQASSLKPNPLSAPSVSGKNQAELKKIAEEFEAIFIAQLLKIMRDTIEESGMTGDGGFGKSIYTELFDQEIALNMARRGALGIGDIIYRSLADQEGIQNTESLKAAQPGKTVSRSAPDGSNKLPASEGAFSGAAESAREISFPVLPVNARISSDFGIRNDPFTGKPKFHKGIDIAAPAGTPVVAALPGKVISAGYESGYGNTVLVEHDGGLRTRYGHLASIDVKTGDMVTSDNTLGKVGSTGRSTGAHLHFEVTRMGKQVDPAQTAALRF